MNIACCVACDYAKRLYGVLLTFQTHNSHIYIYLHLHIKLKLRKIFANLLLHMELSVQDKHVYNKVNVIFCV